MDIKSSFTGRIDELETKVLSDITSKITKEVESQSNDVRKQIISYASTVKKNIDFNSKFSTKVNNSLQKINTQFCCRFDQSLFSL